HDPRGIFAVDARVVRLEAARRDEDRVVLVVDLSHRDVLADVRREAELHVFVDDAAQVAVDHPAREPRRRHAGKRGAARLIERGVAAMLARPGSREVEIPAGPRLQGTSFPGGGVELALGGSDLPDLVELSHAGTSSCYRRVVGSQTRWNGTTLFEIASWRWSL